MCTPVIFGSPTNWPLESTDLHMESYGWVQSRVSSAASRPASIGLSIYPDTLCSAFLRAQRSCPRSSGRILLPPWPCQPSPVRSPARVLHLWPPSVPAPLPPAAALSLRVRTVCDLANGPALCGAGLGTHLAHTRLWSGCQCKSAQLWWHQKTRLVLSASCRRERCSQGSGPLVSCAARGFGPATPLCGEYPGAWFSFRR